MIWLGLLLLFTGLHLPSFCYVRYSAYYVKLIPGWSEFLRQLPVLVHYSLDWLFQVVYIGLGCYLGYLLRTHIVKLPGVLADVLCITIVTVTLNSFFYFVIPIESFRTEFWKILMSDLFFILGSWLLGALIMYVVPGLESLLQQA